MYKLPSSISNMYRIDTFSTESKIFIEKIFKLIQQTNHVSYSDLTISPLLEISKGNHFSLLEKGVQQKIFAMKGVKSHIIEHSFIIDHRTFNVHLTCPSSLFKENKIVESMEKIYSWLFIASHFSQHQNCSKTLDIYIYWTDMKKMLPRKKRAIIDWEHANTAFTFSCNSDPRNGKNEMYIYRYEEWFKVLIHETFHSLALDFSNMTDANMRAEDWIRKHVYHVNANDIRFYEAYTETWAEIFAFIFLADFSLDVLQNILSVEMAWSNFQSIKVLRHYGLEYENLLLFSDKTTQYKENTHVLSYYIMKSVFMNHLNAFIEWTIEENRGSICFKKSVHSVQRFAELLNELAHDEPFLEKTKKSGKWIHEHMDDSSEIMKTIRMTNSA
jgi:hypothetical protein